MRTIKIIFFSIIDCKVHSKSDMHKYRTGGKVRYHDKFIDDSTA